MKPAWRWTLAVGVGYALLALLSLWLSRQPGSLATLWYANAFAVGLLMHRPWQRDAWPAWGAVVLACTAANGLWEPDPGLALAFSVPNVLEIALAVFLLRRAGLHEAGLQSPWALLRLLVLGGVLPQAAGASLGALTLWVALGLDPQIAWLGWYQGAVIGALAMLPLTCMALRRSTTLWRLLLSDGRFLALLPTTAAITLAAMAYTPFPFIFTALPLLLSAMVLPLPAVCCLTFGVSVSVGASLATGLFVPPPVQTEWESAYVYMAFAAALLPAQLLAASMAAVRVNGERLAHRTQELEEANQRLEQFVRMASHDLREPLNTVTQFSGLLRQDLDEQLNPQSREYLRLMDKAARRMRQLLDDVLRYARLRRGQDEPMQTVALGDLLTDVREGLSAAVAQSQAHVRVAPLPQVQGHPTLLSLLFQNLLSNALKFVPPGRSPAVDVRARALPGWQVVTVSDNGIGIAAQDLPRLFKPFARLHPQRTYEGTGLGLTLAQHAAHAHGGRIEIESVLGQGTRVHVWLPAQWPPEHAVHDASRLDVGDGT